ncbi:hypothetical protein PIB30_038984 [Stylosanthes scabra]|uniref:Uncharacterized protein n=1 Tax=Stylosanthes scabra TaxID=79078 RepID=A0ABU6XFG9_9FABA|nr:hypothetical protein [Stylosanthes scabra]
MAQVLGNLVTAGLTRIVPVTAGYSWEPGAETRTPSNTCSKCELNPELWPARDKVPSDYNDESIPTRVGASEALEADNGGGKTTVMVDEDSPLPCRERRYAITNKKSRRQGRRGNEGKPLAAMEMRW